MPPSGWRTPCRQALSPMASSTPAQSDLFSPPTSTASPNATSSPASGDGPMPPASPHGRMTESYGQALARVSRSALRAKEKAPPMIGTYGPTFFGSSVPDGPLASWESRLRERLAMVGSTECALIWREKTSPAGQSTSRLSRSTPLTSAIASIGSPETMEAADPWPTPTVASATGGQSSRSGDRQDEPLLGGLMRGGASPWVTPSARDWKDTAGMATERADGRSRIDQLPRQMVATSGDDTNGSSATTEKRGAPSPAHPCWLMGYEGAFLFVAPKDSPKGRSKAKPKGGSPA